MRLHIVILAAGQGKRMNSARPKVLQPLGESALAQHVIDTARTLTPEAIHVVYGHGGSQVRQALGYDGLRWVEQTEQRGTGHAVAQAMSDIPQDARVLVLYGDVPLVRADTLERLVEQGGDHALALLSVVLDDPTGYGRIVRDDENRIVRVVEQRDATPEEQALTETNTGLLCAPAGHLSRWLSQLTDDNAQGEYYLTDCIEMAVADGVPVVAGAAAGVAETQGVNNKADLARAERHLQQRRAEAAMAAGVTLRDPARIDIRGTLETGRDVLIDIDVIIEGHVVLGDNVCIGPHCVLRDCTIGADSRVDSHTVIEQTRVGAGCTLGPFARLRPETRVADGAKIGNFVETKKTTLGPASKINHLSYVGDAEVGAHVNIGAGVITCNYDGAAKHRTVIGEGAFIGSDCQLVAPVEVGAGATLGAGTTLTRNAPAGTLTVGRARQQTVDGWQRPGRKPADTASDKS